LTQPSERRGKARDEIQWRVMISAPHGTIEGETRNVSLDGLLVCCDEPLRLQETYRMSILPPKHPAIAVSGKVVWSDVYGIDDNDSVFGMGMCMVEIAEKDRLNLEEAIAQESQD